MKEMSSSETKTDRVVCRFGFVQVGFEEVWNIPGCRVDRSRETLYPSAILTARARTPLDVNPTSQAVEARGP